VLYYGKACDLGDISGCRTDGKLAKNEEEKSKWYNKGCDLSDLDSGFEVDRQKLARRRANTRYKKGTHRVPFCF